MAFSQLLSAPVPLRHLLDKHIHRLWVSDRQPNLSEISQSIDARSEYIWLELEARFWEREFLAWNGFVERSSLIFEREGSRLFSAFPQFLYTQEMRSRCVIKSRPDSC